MAGMAHLASWPMTREQSSPAVDAITALGTERLRQLAARIGASRGTDARELAAAIAAALDNVDDLRHQGLTDADVETIGVALGLGPRAAWRPSVSAEEFERLPFYSKPSYDQDVWQALGANWSRAIARPQPRAEGPIDLTSTFIHLGVGASAIPQEPFTGMDWYERYGARTASDGVEGRLVSLFTFSTPWDSWEMHPQGHEVVVCVAGRIVLHQENPDGTTRSTTLDAGQAAINAPGVWHTADVDAPATALFITAGLGTQHRPRNQRASR